MIFLNIITFAIFGIAWFSGGLVRVLGEYWSNENLIKFKETIILGKYIFTGYSIIISILAICIFSILKSYGYFYNIQFFTAYLILVYFVLTYEALSENQHLHQTAYAQDACALRARCGSKHKNCSVPYSSNLPRLVIEAFEGSIATEPAHPELVKPYQQRVGALMYACTATRPPPAA